MTESGKAITDDNVVEINQAREKEKVATKVLDTDTILVQRTLRSGQNFYFEGNVVILGDVNPGAEVVAKGDIIVMGVLRGVVHAGVEGNEQAQVIAFRLQPTQLRIANHITRAPDGEVDGPHQPEIACIKNGTVVIEAFHTGGL
ncbi:MAG TPA: septum site-determining protein MinC [Clostridia bacterium]|nr:septum site-determining protein MinC [Clostridia bacterium]